MARNLRDLSRLIEGFDWDAGNKNKNWIKHKVNKLEAEQVFFNKPLLLSEDKTHSQYEQRYAALGKTNQERKLFVGFTIRNKRIRVISARDQDRQERKIYEQKTQKIA